MTSLEEGAPDFATLDNEEMPTRSTTTTLRITWQNTLQHISRGEK